MAGQNPGDVARDAIEGRTKSRNSLNASYNSLGNSDLSLPPIFQRWMVLDVIFDPIVIDEKKISQLESIHGCHISNASLHAISVQPPRNSIIAKPVLGENKNQTLAEQAMILYPFFPSHLSLPCKPGEHVWVMFESITYRKTLGYWVCSIVGEGHIDDVNHVHHPRTLESTLGYSADEAADKKHLDNQIKQRYHFKNGVYRKIYTGLEGEEYSYTIDVQKEFVKGGVNVYEKVLQNSEASKASVYESIPRFKKRPGDVVLEGSNNSLIVLGRDRVGAAVTYVKDETTNLETIDRTNDELTKFGAGSIDIVAGRGQAPDTSGNSVINELSREELAKHFDSLNQNEGNPDFKNDRSRLYVSQNTSVDKNLELTSYNRGRVKAVEDSIDGDAGIIIKSDKIRIFARSDVQIVVTGFENKTLEEIDAERLLAVEEGKATLPREVKDQKTDSKNWASLTIKSNGDIVIEPSENGYIRLGGEDANKGIVCTSTPVTTLFGGVSGQPLISSNNGQIGGALGPTESGKNNTPIVPNWGTYANKVLVK